MAPANRPAGARRAAGAPFETVEKAVTAAITLGSEWLRGFLAGRADPDAFGGGSLEVSACRNRMLRIRIIPRNAAAVSPSAVTQDAARAPGQFSAWLTGNGNHRQFKGGQVIRE